TIGSGIGGGLVINGEIYRGCGRGAAEIGHLWVSVTLLPPDPSSGASPPALSEVLSSHFLSGILEEIASGWAIGKQARREATRGLDPDSPLSRLVSGQCDRITAVEVGRAAAQGDRLARYILRDAQCILALAIAQVIALLCPRRIVIGGGVSLLGEELLFEPLRRLVAERVFRPSAGLTDIVPAALGEEVVVHGAIALARRKLGPREGTR